MMIQSSISLLSSFLPDYWFPSSYFPFFILLIYFDIVGSKLFFSIFTSLFVLYRLFYLKKFYFFFMPDSDLVSYPCQAQFSWLFLQLFIYSLKGESTLSFGVKLSSNSNLISLLFFNCQSSSKLTLLFLNLLSCEWKGLKPWLLSTAFILSINFYLLSSSIISLSILLGSFPALYLFLLFIIEPYFILLSIISISIIIWLYLLFYIPSIQESFLFYLPMKFDKFSIGILVDFFHNSTFNYKDFKNEFFIVSTIEEGLQLLSLSSVTIANRSLLGLIGTILHKTYECFLICFDYLKIQFLKSMRIQLFFSKFFN